MMKSDDAFRERVVRGLRQTWSDQEVKKRRVLGNRKSLHLVRIEFEQWLNTEPEKRKTQIKFKEQFEIGEGPVTKWKKEILQKKNETL